MSTDYLKIPCELAIFALQEQKYKQAACYTATQFLYGGNAHSSDKPVHKVSSATGYPLKSVYRYFMWLIDRNWIGKSPHGRYYFRGIDRVHGIEGWQFGRAAIMHPKDLKNIKAFMAGVVLASLAKTERGERTERLLPGSKPPASPISSSVLADTLQVSIRTARKLRKLAHKCRYVNSELNLVQITNWTPNDLTELKKQDVQRLPVELLGYADKKIVPLDRIRYENNKLKLQAPNNVEPLLSLTTRRGLLNTAPHGSTNVGSK
jgi:hypothetical protein